MERWSANPPSYFSPHPYRPLYPPAFDIVMARSAATKQPLFSLPRLRVKKKFFSSSFLIALIFLICGLIILFSFLPLQSVCPVTLSPTLPSAVRYTLTPTLSTTLPTTSYFLTFLIPYFLNFPSYLSYPQLTDRTPFLPRPKYFSKRQKWPTPCAKIVKNQRKVGKKWVRSSLKVI